MTAKEWLVLMQKADDYNPAMTKLIEQYGKMLLQEQKETLATNIEQAMMSYGEFYGRCCYFAGKDDKRELPKDEFLQIYKDELLRKL